MKTQCPACRRIYNVASEHLNRRTHCKICGVEFAIVEYIQPEIVELQDVGQNSNAHAPNQSQSGFQVIKKEEKTVEEAAPETPSSGRKRGCIGCLGVLLIFYIIGAFISRNDPPPSLAKQYSSWAIMHCVPAIDKQARYGSDWASIFTVDLFPHAKWLDPETKTILRYSGSDYRDALRFKNAFGTWEPMWYLCDFNVETKEVVKVEVWEKR
jgi:hypothetical protein